MRKILLLALANVFALTMIGSVVWAQESVEEEFTLEEITVTAEKRSQTLQKIPSSIVAFDGDELAQQGKISTAQILESVPNIKVEGGFNNVGIQASTPDVGITIRGVRYKQTSDGQPPATTATYVDGVFQGFGGNLDIERVEVLRGPQGTLYGRSATGGVVNFITRDPKLSEFGGEVSIEVGKASFKNIQVALNAPVGEQFAMRVAARFLERDGYHNPDGGYMGIREGRIKALYQPSNDLDMILSFTINEQRANSGGYSARLLSPGGKIDYKAVDTNVSEGIWKRGLMAALNVNYDFGESILTYIAAWRYYEDIDSPPAIMTRPGAQIMHNQFWDYGEHFRTQEIRLASDSEGPVKWLFGTNYYNSDYDRNQYSVNHRAFIPQLGGIPDPEAATNDAPIFEQPTSGQITNVGFFTEETFYGGENARITAGLRYDRTTVNAYSAFNLNINENEWRNARNPPEWVFFGMEDTANFSNFTYKLRFEYDLTENNMLYALTATGFQPGDLRLTNKMEFGPTGMIPTFFTLPYDEEKLTSYEVGSKNRFMENRLQLNLSAFYYKYSGYRYTVNTALGGPPVFAVLPIPLRMIGAEMDTEWLITAKDKMTFTVGLLDAKMTGYPDIPELNPTRQYMELERLPGLPRTSATLGYDHVFSFGNGSTLVPRADIRYTSGMYVSNLTARALDEGLKPWAYQKSHVIANMGVTWTSANENYSATAYVRNVTDTEYIATANVESGTGSVGVTVGDPRVWGFMFSIKF